jgi:hypothetical protein
VLSDESGVLGNLLIDAEVRLAKGPVDLPLRVRK